MSKALDGEHYCKAHQGNYSHYAEHNCTVCKLKRQRDMLLEALKWLDNWLGDKPLSECGRKIRKTLDAVEGEK